MKRVGIYDPYMHILGGGERYVLAIAQCLSTHAEVTVFADNQELLDQVKTKLGLTIKNTSITPWPSERSERDRQLSRFDLFFYVTDGSLFASSAHKNILIIQSPAHIPKLTLFNRLKFHSWQTIFCYAEFMAQIIKKRLGTIAQPLFVPIPNTSTKKNHKDNLILSVGRFFPQLHNKKQLEMVEMFGEMIGEGLKNTTLFLAGSIDPGGKAYYDMVKNATNEFPIEIVVNAKSAELQKLYAKARIYWHATGFGEDLVNHPEKAEHFGVTTIEAMAHGCVPIVFNGGGQPEIVQHNKNGFLWTTKAELKKYTLEVLTSDALYQKLSQNALESAKLYRQKLFCKKLHALVS